VPIGNRGLWAPDEPRYAQVAWEISKYFRQEKPSFLHLLWGLPLALAVAAAWVIPACIAGGEEYTRIILLKQQMGRVVEAYVHRRPWYEYLLVFPFLQPFLKGSFPVLTIFRVSAADWRLWALLGLGITAGCIILIPMSLNSGLVLFLWERCGARRCCRRKYFI